ncbi:hypothetical protein LYSIN_02663 [Lysinibacillus sphaericus]|uniref:Uncharacterized protein n=1 Tax=Lysinibacillus sphaericus TaxID=1421 RepID=A0A2S5D492_LYSSH|nr:hypothetical protein LYSIN_02663 [Lysinibacillus sphaericus]
MECPLVFSEEIASLIPNAYLTNFEESGHNPFRRGRRYLIALLKRQQNDKKSSYKI